MMTKRTSNNKYECPFEQELLINLESGDMKPHINEHIADCKQCAETVSVFQFMNRFNEEAVNFQVPDKKLPSADEIWDGAFAAPALERSYVVKPAPDKELVRKAMMPVLITQVIMYVTILAGGIYLLMGNLSEVGTFFKTTLGLKPIADIFTSMLGTGGWTSVLYIVPVVGTMALLLYIIFNTEPEPKKRSS